MLSEVNADHDIAVFGADRERARNAWWLTKTTVVGMRSVLRCAALRLSWVTMDGMVLHIIVGGRLNQAALPTVREPGAA